MLLVKLMAKVNHEKREWHVDGDIGNIKFVGTCCTPYATNPGYFRF